LKVKLLHEDAAADGEDDDNDADDLI